MYRYIYIPICMCMSKMCSDVCIWLGCVASVCVNECVCVCVCVYAYVHM